MSSICEPKMFRDDTVFKFNKNGRIKFGLVLESGDNYETENDDEIPFLGEGEISVAWYPNRLHKIIKKGEKIQLACRSLIPNTVVRRTSTENSSDLRGSCKQIIDKVDVQIKGTPYVIKNLPSKRLLPELDIDEPVLLDTWLGRTNEIQWKLQLKTPCGALVEILVGDDFHDFTLRDPIDENRLVSTVFYVGQRLEGFVNSLKKEKWITPKPTYRDNQRISFVVQSFQVVDVWVTWLLDMKNIKSEIDDKDSRPKKHVTGDDVKRLRRVNPHYLNFFNQIGDITFLQITEDDIANARSNVITKTQWIKEVSKHYKSRNTEIVKSTPIDETINVENDDDDDWENDDDDGWQTDDSYSQSPSSLTSLHSKKLKKPSKNYCLGFTRCPNKRKSFSMLNLPSNLPTVGDECIVETLLVHSQATVIWEDGTIESGIPPTQLYPVFESNENLKEYFPGDCVATDSGDNLSENYGIVQKVNRTGRTVIVKWFRTYEVLSTSNISEPVFCNETEASVYDLKFHPDFYFKVGSYVGRIVDFDENEATSALGLIIYTDTAGRVNVWWNDGYSSMCWPQDLLSLQRLLNKKSNSTENHFHEGDESMTKLNTSIDRQWFNVYDSLSDKFEQFFTIDINFFGKTEFSTVDEVMQEFSAVCERGCFIDRLMKTSFFAFKLVLSKIKKSPSLMQKVAQFFPVNFSNQLKESLEGKSTDECDVRSLTSEANSYLLNILSSDTTKKLLEENHYRDLSNKSHDSGHDSNHSKAESGSSSSGTPNDSTTDLDGSSTFESDSHQFSDLTSTLSYLLKLSLSNALKEMKKRINAGCSKTSDKFDFTMKSNVDQIRDSEDTTTDAATLNTDNQSTVTKNSKCFMVLENAPSSHHFFSTVCKPTDSQQYNRAVQSDHKMLSKSLPPGVWARAYEDRMDLLSIMLAGPADTPYEDGLFLFDIRLGKGYPHSPPSFHYISYCSDRLNPNLYVNGKVCVSLLGTWHGKGSELWGSGSTLLQVIVSIQGLILVAEPYFNEVGLDKQKGTQEGLENSQLYNEIVVLKLVESMTKLLSNIPEVFRSEIIEHFCKRGGTMYQRINGWMENSVDKWKTEFPLVPTSRGFCLKLMSLLSDFRNKLDATNQ